MLIQYVSAVMRKLSYKKINDNAWSLRKALMVIKLLTRSKAISNFIGCLLTVSALIWWFNYQY